MYFELQTASSEASGYVACEGAGLWLMNGMMSSHSNTNSSISHHKIFALIRIAFHHESSSNWQSTNIITILMLSPSAWDMDPNR